MTMNVVLKSYERRQTRRKAEGSPTSVFRESGVFMESLFSILLFVAFLYLMMRFGCGAHMRSGGCGHSSHAPSKTHEHSSGPVISGANQMTRDPVCGMEIDMSEAAHSTHYGTDTFYFCSDECHRKFGERPEYFAEIVRMEKRYVA